MNNNNDLVIIKLDRPRELKFGYGAMKQLVAITGMTIEEIDDGVGLSDFDKIETMIYCGLLKDAKEHNETIKPELVPALLEHASNYMHIYEQLIVAWRAAFGVKVEPFEGNPQTPVEQPAQEHTSTSKKTAK